MNPPIAPRAAAPAEPAAGAALLAKLDSARLFDGKRELIIVHQGEEYRLRITRQEKLILTK
ncbi:MAG: hemin uptake protein HemP [Lacisediminimonas sp.]|nr:hemin uptake protein HemP [Lacisediminimonas sp.]